MIFAIDIHYREPNAKAVGVLFNWQDSKPQDILIKYIDEVNPYIPGEFYKRELPCILEVLELADLKTIKLIIVDSHVYINDSYKYGLGGYLWEALNKQIPVIGIAKSSFKDAKIVSKELYRGNSKKPLFLSSIGINIDEAFDEVKKLHGNFRMPTILKKLDSITKED